MTDVIHCPNCQYQIEVSAVLAAQLREQVRKEQEAEARRLQQELSQQQDALREQELAIERSRRALDSEVTARVEQQRAALAEEALATARAGVALEVQDLQAQLADSSARLAEARLAELQLRKDRRQLEEEKESLQLTVIRTLDQERDQLKIAAKQQADEEHRLKEADKDKVIDDLRKQIDVLKRKAEQGSMQVQGEVMELDLEAQLTEAFPADRIEPVPVGIHGGDVKQHVHNSNGLDCGVILWESKRTKSWKDGWLSKMREDQRSARADLAVIMSAELPKGVTTFAFLDGVWVCSRASAVLLASALRQGLIEVARTRRAHDGKQSKAELLHAYLAGPEFRQRVEGIVEALVNMKCDLESEKRSFQRLWNKREKQIERGVVNAASLYGDLGGIMGASLPQIPMLALTGLDATPALGLTEDEADSA